jgi:DNA gyrase/topoisomerase IV subunit A
LVCPINKDHKYVINQDAGYGFVVTADNLMTRQKAGKEMVTVWDNSKIFQPLPVNNNEDTAVIRMGVITTENKFLMYKLNNISVIGKGKGVVTCGLPEVQKIKDVKLIRPGEEIRFSVTSKNGKETEFLLKEEESVQFEKGRATKGNFLPLKDKDKTSEIKFVK